MKDNRKPEPPPFGAVAPLPAWALALRIAVVVVFMLVLGLWLAEAIEETSLHYAVLAFEAWLEMHVPEGLLQVLKVIFWFSGIVLATGLIWRVVHIERKRNRLQAELTAALGHLLSGFVPICMYCKKIRDANENWTGIESYLETRTDLEFSHGMCPACYAEHFPED